MKKLIALIALLSTLTLVGPSSSFVFGGSPIDLGNQGAGGGGFTVSSVLLYDGNGYGSTNTHFRKYNNTVTDGVGLTGSNSASLGARITVNVPGLIQCGATDRRSGAADSLAIGYNDVQGTTQAASSAAWTGVIGNSGIVSIIGTPGGGNDWGSVTTPPFMVQAGDYIVAHTDSGVNDTSDVSRLKCTLIHL